MLTITQINYIRKMYFDKGFSVSEIEKRTTHSRNTILKYIEQEDFNDKRHRRNENRKSDLVRPFVRQILLEDKNKRKKQRHTAKRIYERALEEIPELCQIKERQMRTIVAEERKEIYAETECFLDLEHPGGEAQVDFGEIDIYEDGKLVKAHEFVMTFPSSNAGFCQITKSETMEAVCDSLEKIFKHIGKIPKKIWFDQMAAAALRQKDEHGIVMANLRFQKFAMHYGFEINFCNANSGNEKGSVENKVGYFRNNLFIPEPKVHDLESFNQELLKRCDNDNKREHYKNKPETIQMLFDREKERMHAVNARAYDHARETRNHVHKNGHIKVDTNEYSVSPSKVGEKVIVKYYANELIIYDSDYREITRHKRSFEKGKKFTHWIDFITLVAKRPKALKYTGFYGLLPDIWQMYLAALDKEALSEALTFLKFCLLEKSFDFASKVLEENMNEKVNDPSALWTTYYRLNENQALYLKGTTDTLPRLPEYTLQLDDYDMLLGGVLS